MDILKEHNVKKDIFLANLSYEAVGRDDISSFVEAGALTLRLHPLSSHIVTGDMKLDNLWTAVSLLQGIRNCSPAARLGLVNLLELIWGSEEQNNQRST